jgi:pimeloyl-ACP methyl ester carboxylesterase
MGRDSSIDRRRGFDLLGLGDLSSELAQIPVPVAVLSGIDDPATPVPEAALLADSVGEGRLRLLPDTAHLLPLERPDAVAQEIVRLLEPRRSP